MIEDNKLTDSAVAEIDKIIHEPKLQQEMAAHNYSIARILFSYDTLREKLEILLHKF